MNQLINASQSLTMSSREIAELTGKQHKDVLYDIRKMLIDLELTTAEFSAVYKADNGQEYECFNLDKENTLILVSGYNVKIRQAIIRRWQELENNNPKLPTTYKAALLALVAAEEERERLELENINLTTVVDDLTDWSSIIRIAKHNGVSEKVFKWRLLKAKSLELGYAIKQVPSARYDYQNLYHLNSFRACYPQFDYNLNREVLK